MKIYLHDKQLAVCRCQVVRSKTRTVLKHPLLGGFEKHLQKIHFGKIKKSSPRWNFPSNEILSGICHQVHKSGSTHLGLDVVEPWKHPWLGVKSQTEPT